MANTDLRIKLKIDSDTKELIVTQGNMNKLSKSIYSAQQRAKGFTQSLIGITKATVGLYAVKQGFDAIISGFTNFVNTSAEFERFETTLTTIEGSSVKAKESMAWIQDFATNTPYQLTQVTESFVKLKAYGIDPTNGTLKTLGDTASAMGKPLMQAVEAMADALTGENERLKEFGIKASVQGDKVAYNWMDASGRAKHIIIENNAEIIQSTLSAIFNSKYEGAMQQQMQTYDGMMSNLSDSWTRFKKEIMDAGLFAYVKAFVNQIGKVFNNMFKQTTDGATEFTNNFIGGFNSIITAIGFVKDAISGIGLVLKAVKFAFIGIVKYFSEAINTPIHLLNSAIEAYNKLSSTFGGESIDFKFEKIINTNSIDKELKDTWASMQKDVDALIKQPGVTFAKQFSASVMSNFKEIQAGVQAAITSAKSTVTGAKDGNIRLGSSSSTDKDLKKSQNAYLTYYETIGNYSEAWAIKQQQLMEEYKPLIGEEKAKEMAEAMKKNYFDRIKDDAKSTFEKMQATIKDNLTSGFEEFFNFTKEGFADLKKLGESVVNAIISEIIKVQIAKPLASAATSIFSSFFANGGIMTPQGSLPLKAYSTGGIANSPQLAVFGEGRMNEAYVPLPDGKTIPVTMKGNSGSNVIVQITNNTSQEISADQISESTRTNSRGEQEKVINIVMDGVSRNVSGIRDMLKGMR